MTRQMVWRLRQCNCAGIMRSSAIRSVVCITRGMIGTVYRGSRRSRCDFLKHEYTGVDPLICSIYTLAASGHWGLLFVRSSPSGSMDQIGPNTLAEMVTILVAPSSNLLTTKLIIFLLFFFSISTHTHTHAETEGYCGPVASLKVTRRT